jgi:signal transduction histidine kinase
MPNPDQSLQDEYRKEYAEFIALAVHELDTPLRKLSVLIDRLKTNTALGNAGDPYLPRIELCLADMRTLINTLSGLSNCASTKRKSKACDLGRLVEKLAQDIPLLQQEGTLNMSSLPVISGDPEQFELLFRNLLENAARFKKKEKKTCVDIHIETLFEDERESFALKQDRIYYKIVISDNGIGFPAEYANEIFKPFVRLHGKSDYPGNGIGLALCKKIMENHEGIIYAESPENEGARFILILPLSLN